MKYLYLFKTHFYSLILVTMIFRYQIEILILLFHLKCCPILAYNLVQKAAHVRVWLLETGLGRLSCVWHLEPSVYGRLGWDSPQKIRFLILSKTLFHEKLCFNTKPIYAA